MSGRSRLDRPLIVPLAETSYESFESIRGREDRSVPTGSDSRCWCAGKFIG